MLLLVVLCCCCAAKFGLKVNLAAKGDNKSVPARDSWKLSPDAKYVHYCDNETIGGEQAHTLDTHTRTHTYNLSPPAGECLAGSMCC